MHLEAAPAGEMQAAMPKPAFSIHMVNTVTASTVLLEGQFLGQQRDGALKRGCDGA